MELYCPPLFITARVESKSGYFVYYPGALLGMSTIASGAINTTFKHRPVMSAAPIRYAIQQRVKARTAVGDKYPSPLTLSTTMLHPNITLQTRSSPQPQATLYEGDLRGMASIVLPPTNELIISTKSYDGHPWKSPGGTTTLPPGARRASREEEEHLIGGTKSLRNPGDRNKAVGYRAGAELDLAFSRLTLQAKENRSRRLSYQQRGLNKKGHFGNDGNPQTGSVTDKLGAVLAKGGHNYSLNLVMEISPLPPYSNNVDRLDLAWVKGLTLRAGLNMHQSLNRLGDMTVTPSDKTPWLLRSMGDFSTKGAIQANTPARSLGQWVHDRTPTMVKVLKVAPLFPYLQEDYKDITQVKWREGMDKRRGLQWDQRMRQLTEDAPSSTKGGRAGAVKNGIPKFGVFATSTVQQTGTITASLGIAVTALGQAAVKTPLKYALMVAPVPPYMGAETK